MDVTLLRSSITVLCFIVYIGIVLWAYSSARRERFDKAANLPFAESEMHEKTVQMNRQRVVDSGEH